MPAGKDITVIEFDGRTLLAVAALVSSDQVLVKHTLIAHLPASIPATSPQAVGEWVGIQCDKANIPKSRTIFALQRADVVLKQILLPPQVALSQGELANLVRLQLIRQLSMHVEGAPIDFIPPHPAHPENNPEASLSSRNAAPQHVLAAAVPADRFAWVRAVALAAGMKLTRVTLRCCGAASLIAELSQRHAGVVLGITVGPRSVEYVAVADGTLVFARAADITFTPSQSEHPSPAHTNPAPETSTEADAKTYPDAYPEPPTHHPTPEPVTARPATGEISENQLTRALQQDALADRAVVEAKRTWMAFTAGQGGILNPPQRIAISAPSHLAKLIGERAALSLESQWEFAPLPSIVTLPANNANDHSTFAPLLGILTDLALARPTLDFANPRRLPDPAAKRRKLVLASTLGLILACGGTYILADRALSGLRSDLAAAQANESQLRKNFDALQLRHAKVSHFDTWVSAKVDWLGHLQKLSEHFPPPSAGVVDEISARGITNIRYALGTAGTGYIGGKWSATTQVVFDLGGKVRSRQIAADLRERMMNGGIYGVESQGPDAQDKFAFGLSSLQLSPFKEPVVTPAVTTPQKKTPTKPATPATSIKPASKDASNPAPPPSKPITLAPAAQPGSQTTTALADQPTLNTPPTPAPANQAIGNQ